MNFIKRLLITTVVVVLLAYFLDGVSVDSPVTAIIVAVVMALLNTFIKPILVFFTFPITVLTLGLFLLIINAGMVLLCDKLVDGFDVATFLSAVIFSVLLSISQWILYKFIKD